MVVLGGIFKFLLLRQFSSYRNHTYIIGFVMKLATKVVDYIFEIFIKKKEKK